MIAEKTSAEVAALKADWYSDGGWDLEDTEGFEAHRDELKAYRLQVEGQRAERRAKEHKAAIEGLMSPALQVFQVASEAVGLEAVRQAPIASADIGLVLRAVAEMLLPIVQRLERLDEANDRAHESMQREIDRKVGPLGF